MVTREHDARMPSSLLPQKSKVPPAADAVRTHAPAAADQAAAHALLQPLLCLAILTRLGPTACLHVYNMLALAVEQALGDRWGS